MNKFKNELRPYKCIVFVPSQQTTCVIEVYATTKAHALSIYRKFGFIPNTRTCKQYALFDYITSTIGPDQGNWSLKSIPSYGRHTSE